jgi:hypothetical protein
MKNKPSHFTSNSKPAKTGLLEFDLLAVQCFLELNSEEFKDYCADMDISEDDADRIIEGLI